MKFINVKKGLEVMVYDRHRFAIPLKGRVISLSSQNDGVCVRLLKSNNYNYPIESETWVHAQQLKRLKKETEG